MVLNAVDGTDRVQVRSASSGSCLIDGISAPSFDGALREPAMGKGFEKLWLLESLSVAGHV